jgi:hypothetical protein
VDGGDGRRATGQVSHENVEPMAPASANPATGGEWDRPHQGAASGEVRIDGEIAVAVEVDDGHLMAVHEHIEKLRDDPSSMVGVEAGSERHDEEELQSE